MIEEVNILMERFLGIHVLVKNRSNRTLNCKLLSYALIDSKD